MRRYYLAISIAIVTLLGVFTGHAIAQSTPFSISGQVVDAKGNPVTGAIVTLIDNNYNVLGTETTGQDGTYDFLNVVSNTSMVTVSVSFTADGVAYTLPSYFTRWYPTQGIQIVPSSETQFYDYPPPTYGYVFGAIETPDNQFIDGVVYMVNVNTGITYYEFANSTSGFSFYVLPGNYWLYAQHYQNGVIYESAHHQFKVAPLSNINGPSVDMPWELTISLDSPDTAPGEGFNVPLPHVNVVNGTVLYSDGYPVANVTVTLYEESDNGTVFLPTNYTTTTDYYGNYTFSGVVPMSDTSVVPMSNTGVVIQSSKPIEAVALYYDSNGTLQSYYSSPETLYYPDIFLGYGDENAARNITVHTITIPSAWSMPQPSVTAEPTNTPSAPSPGLAAEPFTAAVAIGIICLAGVYFLLYRKS
jgi:hypothetical protein